MSCPATGYGGLSLTIRVYGASRARADTRFRAVGHRKGQQTIGPYK